MPGVKNVLPGLPVLLACGHCGGDAQYIDNNAPMSILFAVECRSCQIRTAWFRSKYQAAEYWNRRAPEPGTSVVR